MKKIIIILLLMSCHKEEIKPLTGCHTAIRKGTTNRIFIHCCTKDQYMAGNNVSNGGIINWNDYERHEWTQINCQCK